MVSNEFAIQLGKRIEFLRKQQGYTQEELATKLGYSGKSIISKFEKGRNEPPASKLFEFASALNTNVAFLMGWDNSLRGLSQDEYELIELYRKSTAHGKALAIGNLQASQEDTVSAVG